MKRSVFLAVILLSILWHCAGYAEYCTQGEATRIWITPQKSEPEVPVKIMAVSTVEPLTNIRMISPQGETLLLPTTAGTGGLPWHITAETGPLGNGLYQVEAQSGDRTLACLIIGNGHDTRDTAGWDEMYEAFYAAWIEKLFDGGVDEDISFPSLEPVLRDPERNFLLNTLGLEEDAALSATPDCADFPYFLRSYFAWKNGLPFSYRQCNRGRAGKPPSCESAIMNTDFVQRVSPASKFRAMSIRLMDAVHSGNGRTALDDEQTDFYPVALQRETLWPGTVYADPYGHTLVLTKWVEQTGSRPGLLFAVDAQPDNSIARKRFWEGTFLFTSTDSAGPGFKRFRPIVDHRLLKNGEIPEYSPEQAELPSDVFYARMHSLLNPAGLDAGQAYEATLAALVEQLETRVRSVENGEAYFRRGGATIPMPKGAAIFETIGPWEDFSTPSRDMRLLIAMDVLLDFPAKVQQYPRLFHLTPTAARQMRKEIEQLHNILIAQKKIRYIRSNGEPWELSVADILARRAAFEMAYNPNDCVEIRWGAEPGTEEYVACQRRAPAAQIKQMESVRAWFRDTERPPR
ncbi:hypothetical protein [Desulfobulbus oligotrophicus]|uniref:Uncharacterized protein n=1 Tax=Desulfobulbus oligotrophicus TaxID=1909699 RepID=A0A7T6ARG0_9BACT|nr:hypothetical protein [Desulfobulbus oligotrophicus]QQG66502.1 hypothetical protein HP555_11805 [Desulfobulbus oligotrophicus]